MSERKALNRYIPHNFDPSKIPKGHRSAMNYMVRLMSPFSMRCNSCNEYIYKGKKFNARKEIVWGENYLGIQIFRFYIKCPQCAGEIAFKTDPKNTDYICEAGALRNFEPWKREEQESQREKEERLKDEEQNPMRALENRTLDSKKELEIAEALDEIRTLNARHEKIDFENLESLLHSSGESSVSIKDSISIQQEEEDEQLIKKIFHDAANAHEEASVDFNLDPSSAVKPLLKNVTAKPMVKKKLNALDLGIIVKRKDKMPENGLGIVKKTKIKTSAAATATATASQ